MQNNETVVKHVLRYQKKTSDYKLHFNRTGKLVERFVDADCVFSWESKKQSVVALSSTEAEYRALSTAAKEAAYINKFLEEMGFKQSGPLILNNDNFILNVYQNVKS